MSKCGTCVYAQTFPEDLKQRICKGGPPQVVPLIVGPGQIQIRNMWPMVMAADEGCGIHKPKILIDSPEGNA